MISAGIFNYLLNLNSGWYFISSGRTGNPRIDKITE